MSRSKLVPCLFVVAAGLSAVGCVDDGDSTVVILQNQAPAEGCVVTGTPTDSFISSGTIDARSEQGYVFTPVAKNFAVAAEGQERLRIAFVEGARVEIAFTQDPELFSDGELAALEDAALTRFQVPMTGPINPEATTSFRFEIVPPELLELIADKLPFTDGNGIERDSTLLEVAIRLYGNLSDSDFESQLFRYPVDVCIDCLINDFGACSALSSDFSPVNLGGECNVLQDAVVDCCTTDTGLVCPAVGTMTPPA